MLNLILTVGGWAIFGVAVFLWIRWAERERDVFANGNGKWLE
jgi:hypothetical protein